VNEASNSPLWPDRGDAAGILGRIFKGGGTGRYLRAAVCKVSKVA
jgi:hypothetical protein